MTDSYVAADWYRDVVDFADRTPHSVQQFGADFAEIGIVLLALTWLLVFWRARRAPAHSMAVVLVGAVGVAVSYGLSEWAKTVVDSERPCQRLPDVRIIAHSCPPPGDWSFPSNHATIAGAFVTAIFFASWRLGLWALPVALLVAFSRVFVGVHYPHDVAAGLAAGAVVTAAMVVALGRPATTLMVSLRERPLLSRLLTAEPEPVGPRPTDRGQLTR